MDSGPELVYLAPSRAAGYGIYAWLTSPPAKRTGRLNRVAFFAFQFYTLGRPPSSAQSPVPWRRCPCYTDEICQG